MEQNIKPITKQLAIAIFMLALVIALSLGIRYVRFSVNLSNTTESPITANLEDQFQPERPTYADTEPYHYPAEPYTIDYEPAPQYSEMPDRDEQKPSNDYVEEYTDLGKYDKTISVTWPYKDDNSKSEGTKDFQRIPLSYYEDLYINEEGKLWYVNENPNGSVDKMQLQIDEMTGVITVGEIYLSD
jgi:hypothetical protein